MIVVDVVPVVKVCETPASLRVALVPRESGASSKKTKMESPGRIRRKARETGGAATHSRGNDERAKSEKPTTANDPQVGDRNFR